MQDSKTSPNSKEKGFRRQSLFSSYLNPAEKNLIKAPLFSDSYGSLLSPILPYSKTPLLRSRRLARYVLPYTFITVGIRLSATYVGFIGTVVTGTGEFFSTFSVTLPKRKFPFSPWLAMTTMSTSSSSINFKIS